MTEDMVEKREAEVAPPEIELSVNVDEKQRGASLVEYALLVALIAVVAIAAVRILGQTVSGQFSAVNTQITG